jgi:S-adenosylmethionine decarboxylase
MYKPGKHIIATLLTSEQSKIEKFDAFKECIDGLIQQHGLSRLGEVFHNFSPAGFTGVVCLSESHVSIHTWPEHGKINIDIYLSNYERDNDGTVTELYEKIAAFFNATTEQLQTIHR